jgi:predicted dienelactone hydrolase
MNNKQGVFIILALSVALLIFFLIWNNYEMSPTLTKTLATDSSEGSHLVSVLEGSFSDEIYGLYKVTIYYPAVNSGVSQLPERSGAPYPAIVFAHGWLASKEVYTWIGNSFAAHGYVTILFTVPTPTSLNAFSQSVRGIIGSIDYLLTQNAGGLLKGMIDDNRIGVMGHSMGAMAVLIATAEDSRIKAAVSLAPGYFGVATEKYVEACSSISVPIQLQAGSLDAICPPSAVKVYYDALTIPTKEIIVINGADHIQFSDVSAGLGRNISLEEQHGISQKYFIAWFNYYLYDDFNYYAYIFGDDARMDLHLGVLSYLDYAEKTDC